MDIQNVRMLLKSKSIYDIPLRVTFYARVSSETDEQLNSLDNQISYFENLITKNKAWTYVSGYVDEGLSGISTKKRENFNQMISDAEDGLFDLIITKEISRFARNTLDSLQFTRELFNYGVCVFFQNDNINTVDEDSELRLTIMSSIAQDELRKLSSRIKFGHQQAIKSNVVLGNSRIFGYLKENGKLVIDETQAPMVRELFELYSTDEYSMKQLEKIFYDKGYRNYKGNKIAHSTMSNIISNPKYKGYYVGNKVKVIDMFTKKQKFLPPDEWVMFKDETGEIVPAIVDEGIWEKANIVLQRRSEDVKNRQGKCSHGNLFTGKLICTHCGKPYYRKESKDKSGNINSKWICSGKINNGADSCPSFAVFEKELIPIIYDVFSDTKVDVEKLLEEYFQIYVKMQTEDAVNEQITECENKIKLLEDKKMKLLDLVTLGKISDNNFSKMLDACDTEIKETTDLLIELNEKNMSRLEFKKHISMIKHMLEKAAKDAENGIISKDFVNSYIDKIYITPIDDMTARFDIKIFTGKNVEKLFDKVSSKKSRTGQTFKKMIEAYENGNN